MQMCCIVFEKKQNITINDMEDVDEVFVSVFSDRKVAENWIDEHYPNIKDHFLYRECIVNYRM